METVKQNIRMVEDFPEKGVVFIDLTTVFKKHECMKKIEDALYETYKNAGVTKVIGIDVTDVSFWKNSLAIIEEDINEFMRLSYEI